MTTKFLQERARQPEMMDDPDINPELLDHAMRHLEIINRFLNGYGPSLAGLRLLLPSGCSSFTLLDVGCGNGDTMRRIARWARRRRIEAELTGIELCEQSASRAAEACKNYPEISIRHANLFSMPENSLYDISHCALVLHHFSQDEDAAKAIRKMSELSRLGIVVNDLHRHPLAYHSIRLLTRTFSRSAILRNDAPLSVARSFTRSEFNAIATKAGLERIQIQWHWAFRWLLTASFRSQDIAIRMAGGTPALPLMPVPLFTPVLPFKVGQASRLPEPSLQTVD